jgi:feruloyl esterase
VSILQIFALLSRLGFSMAGVLLAAGVLVASPAAAASCESLASLSLPNTTITHAEVIAAGTFTAPVAQAPTGVPPALMVPPPSFAAVPAFCRVQATLTPTSDSDIKVEVWLPVSGWNGKYQSVGNGGWAGMISYPAMAEAVKGGYATSSTDTGHVGGSGQFALGHPEKLIDYAYRSEHEMTLKAKAIIQAFYGNAPKYSYWNGCSTGGKQGLTEAQRYPDDYDGIIAGAPANYMIHLHAWSIALNLDVTKTPASFIPPEKYPAIHKAVLEACDAKDGVKDGVLENPKQCQFDPEAIECEDADAPSCLTASQVEAAKAIYAPLVNPRTKQLIFPSVEPGSEMGWSLLAGQNPVGIAIDTFKYVIFKDPNWDYHTLNFDHDIDYADKVDDHLNNAIDPDLRPFFRHGGKLIMYHGWNDTAISPGNSVNYYESVLKAVGSSAKNDIVLFMAPGMNHCRGGDGPNLFDPMPFISDWVENGKMPEKIIASHATKGTTDRTRPVCPYPQVAKYNGSGSTDDAANFACATP